MNTEDREKEAHESSHESPHKNIHTNSPIEPNKEAVRKNHINFPGDGDTNTTLKSQEEDAIGLLDIFCTDCVLIP